MDGLKIILESGEVFLPSVETTFFLALVLICWYYVFWKPLDVYFDFTKFGFDDGNFMKQKTYKTDSAKREAINDLIRLRKSGDIPPPYPNGWFVVLESHDLITGYAKEVNVLGLNLVVWRGQSGKSYVANAYCPHLGAHLGVGGKVQGECIRCPFHGWEFSGCNGHLKNIPYSDSHPEFAKLKIWKTLEGNGVIYLWYHAEVDEPSWKPHIYPEIESGSWKYRGRGEFKVACHIQDCLENVADFAHLNVIHSGLTGGDQDHSWFRWELIKLVWSNSIWRAFTNDGEKHKSKFDVCTHGRLFGRYNLSKTDLNVTMIGPGLVSLEFNEFFGSGVLFSFFTPLEPLQQRTLHRFYSSCGFIHPLGKLLLLAEVAQVLRDAKIWNRKTYIKNPLYTKEDRYIKEFRKWYSQFYTENSTKSCISSISNKDTLQF